MADMGMLSFQTPEEVAAARRLSDEQQVRDLSKMSAGEWGNYGLLTSAQSMGRAIGAATGYVDPNEARAQKTQQVMSSPDSDLNTSKGMLAKAAELRTIDPRLSMQLLLKGRELEKQEQAAVLAQQKQDTQDTLSNAQANRANAIAEQALSAEQFKNLPPEVQALMQAEKLEADDPKSSAAKGIRAWLEQKSKGKGEWSDPYSLSGATVQKNLQTGEIRTAVSRAPATNIRIGPNGKVKPKGLSPEASLKWDFDNELLDEETYKMAIAGRPGSKVMAAADTDRKKTEGFLAAAGYNPDTGSDKVEELIKKSTSGGLETGAAALAAFFGASTEGRVAINTLSAASNTITMEMMGGKLGAGVSNADRDFIVGQLGDVSNSNKPIPERLAAWKFAKDRMISVGLLKPKSGATKVPNRIKFDAQGNMVK